MPAYSSPGVSVAETVNPALAPLIANPNVVCIVGAAAGSQVASERLILNGTTPVTLRHTGISLPSVIVTSGSTGEVLNPGTYVLVQSGDPDVTVTGDETYTLARFGRPTAAPIAANTGTGTLTGTYRYAYSYVNANGETGISPASADTVFSGANGANLTNVTVGPTGTTARNVYRSKVVAGVPGTYRLVATIANNTATTLSNETTSDATADAAAAAKTGIDDGSTVVVSYTFTDNHYYEPTFLTDYDDVIDKYGPPFDAVGNISSPLSFATRLAFQNGASEVVTLAATGSTDQALADAFSKLEGDPSIRIITVASGSTAVHTALSAHLTNMGTQGYYRQGIVGRDGSVTAIPATVLRPAAQGFNNEALIHVSPASFKLQNPVTGRDMFVGGQYAAAAVLGMFAARDVQVPLTRKSVAGFLGLGDRRTPTEQALDSQAGLFVIRDNGGVLQVRHQVTTAVQSASSGEASVVRAKYDMAHRTRSALDGSVIGQVIPEGDAPLVISGIVSGVLEEMLIEGAINGYGQVKARLLDTDATTVEVRFEYRPAFPINNIVVRFSINTTSGDLTVV